MDASRMRWQATVTYRTDAGPVTVEHLVEELQDLQQLVEKGPHFDCVELIEVRVHRHATHPLLTVEQAEKL